MCEGIYDQAVDISHFSVINPLLVFSVAYSGLGN